MQELTEIDSLTAHSCAAPRIERWHVLEPVSGRWTWLCVFACCRQVLEEPVAQSGGETEREVRRAA